MHTAPFAEFLVWVSREPREERVFKTLARGKPFRTCWNGQKQRLQLLNHKAMPQSYVGLAKVWMQWQALSEEERRHPAKFQGRTRYGQLDLVAAPFVATILRDYVQSPKRQTDKS